MGIFDRIKKNITHGGLSLEVQIPPSISANDPALPITATFTNSGAEPRMINKVTAQLTATTNNMAFRPADSPAVDDRNSTQPTSQTLARTEVAQPFTLGPGQTQNVQLNIVMNEMALSNGMPPAANPSQPQNTWTQLAQKAMAVEQSMNHGSYDYSVNVDADIEGIALDIGKSKSIQVLDAGGLGASFNVGV